jgi:hypothetical protein
MIPLEDKLTDLDTSVGLRRVGVPQNSEYFWAIGKRSKQLMQKQEITVSKFATLEILVVYSAFNFEELWKMLPPKLNHYTLAVTGDSSLNRFRANYVADKDSLLPYDAVGTIVQCLSKVVYFLYENDILGEKSYGIKK